MAEIYNIVIIGSGPAGLTAALYAARANLRPLVIAGLTPGGQLMQTTEVENYPGFPEGILGPELMLKMTKQAERFGAKIVNETVADVSLAARPFRIKTDRNEYDAKTVVVATGAEANWLNLPNEQRLRGKGVSACATCDGFFFKGKEVAVVGGGDSAMEEALFLSKFATKVTILHRSDQFRASKIMLGRVQANPKIALMTNVEVVDVLGVEKVEGLKLRSTASNSETTFKTDGLFLAIGRTPASEVFKGKLDLDAKGYGVITGGHTGTNIEGVFWAGDVADPRYRQAVTAAGEGCRAAIDAERFLAERGEIHEEVTA